MAYLLVIMTCLLGGVSLFVFSLFLFFGPLGLINLELDAATALCFDAALSLAFFVQHSVMMRKSLRQLLGRLLPEKYHGALFTITSGMFVLGVVFCWQGLDYQLVTLAGWGRGVWRAVFFLAMAGFISGVVSLGFFDPFGVVPILPKRYAIPSPPKVLVVHGPYRWVRHPLYFFVILLMWSFPDLTPDRLLFNLLWTAWIIIGAKLEERDLVATFGQAYLEYQRTVPMLLPYGPLCQPKT